MADADTGWVIVGPMVRAVLDGRKGVTKDGTLVKYGIPDRDGWPGTDDDGRPWHEWHVDPRLAYAQLWDRLNADRAPWSSNPEVVVISFRPIAQNVDAVLRQAA